MPEETIAPSRTTARSRSRSSDGHRRGAGRCSSRSPRPGVDYDDVVDTLEREGVEKFADSFTELLDGIAAKRGELVCRLRRSAWRCTQRSPARGRRSCWSTRDLRQPDVGSAVAGRLRRALPACPLRPARVRALAAAVGTVLAGARPDRAARGAWAGPRDARRRLARWRASRSRSRSRGPELVSALVLVAPGLRGLRVVDETQDALGRGGGGVRARRLDAAVEVEPAHVGRRPAPQPGRRRSGSACEGRRDAAPRLSSSAVEAGEEDEEAAARRRSRADRLGEISGPDARPRRRARTSPTCTRSRSGSSARSQVRAARRSRRPRTCRAWSGRDEFDRLVLRFLRDVELARARLPRPSSSSGSGRATRPSGPAATRRSGSAGSTSRRGCASGSTTCSGSSTGRRPGQIDTFVLLGMGGSSLAPEVLRRTFGADASPRARHDPPARDPAARRSSSTSTRTLFVAASKSGTTLETRWHLDYFWERSASAASLRRDHRPGSELEQFAGSGASSRSFDGEPTIGGRYSALSLFGIVPAALMGVDARALLERADDDGRGAASARRIPASSSGSSSARTGPRAATRSASTRHRAGSGSGRSSCSPSRRARRARGSFPHRASRRTDGPDRQHGRCGSTIRTSSARVLPLGVRDRRRRLDPRHQPVRPAGRAGGEGQDLRLLSRADRP